MEGPASAVRGSAPAGLVVGRGWGEQALQNHARTKPTTKSRTIRPSVFQCFGHQCLELRINGAGLCRQASAGF